MKIKKAKADAPLWVPQVNEMCEYLTHSGRWTRCTIKTVRVGAGPNSETLYELSFENGHVLKSADMVRISNLREGTAPASKKDQIVRLLKLGENAKALAMAAKFQDLGEHRDAITKGANAAKNPDFYRQIRQDPAALVAAGIAALRARYLEE